MISLQQIKKYPLGLLGAFVIVLFILVGIYAPFLASSKPLVVSYDGAIYWPLFRYLFFSGFFSKPLDIFFNLLIFTLPLALIYWRRPKWILTVALFQVGAFVYLMFDGINDPASNRQLATERQALIQSGHFLSWQDELKSMNSYAQLNAVLRYYLGLQHHQQLEGYLGEANQKSLWAEEQKRLSSKKQQLTDYLQKQPDAELQAKELQMLEDKQLWLNAQVGKINWMIMPLIRPFHWEDDVGGGQELNQALPWWELTRINRKDMVAALIFGVRISLVVGFLAVFLALAIGVPIGALAGYYGGIFDIVVSRLLEIWESMPTFFMLLLVIAMVQSKSIFIVIAVIGIFGWTGFSRYIRGEFFKQRNLSYVEACRSIGFNDSYIIFRHILPNAIPPLLTLLPFAIMGAISSEAGLSFLGLGEEGSCSWGVLMDEGRSAFPGQAYLLWPPAILLTILLVAIALVGDALRDILDPKLKS